MYQLYSRKPSHIVSLRGGKQKLTTLSNGEIFKEPVPGVAVRFQPLGEGVPIEGMPAKKGPGGVPHAEGTLSIESGSKEANMEKLDFVQTMLDHGSYGVEFIFVNAETGEREDDIKTILGNGKPTRKKLGTLSKKDKEED